MGSREAHSKKKEDYHGIITEAYPLKAIVGKSKLFKSL